MKKFFIILVSVLVTFISLSVFANGSSDQEKSESVKIAVVLKTLSNPYWVAMEKGVKEEAKKLGIEVDTYAAQSEDDTSGQLRLFEDLVGKKYNAIAFAPLSPVNLISGIEKAYKKGIFLVNIDEKVDAAQLKSAGANVFAFMSTDNFAVGEKAGNYIVETIGSGKVVIIEGKAGNSSGEDRKNGAKQAFDNADGIELVSSQPADWDRTKGLDVATNMIQRYPDLKAIYCANDTMALGAMKAVENSGKDIIVVGTDGVPEAIDMVNAGRLAATVAQDPAEMGREAVRQLVSAVKVGKQIAVDATAAHIAIDSQLILKK